MPVLINQSVVIPAGSVMRFFYVRPYLPDDKVKLVDPKEHQAEAYSRNPTGIGVGPAVYISPQMEATLRAAHKTVLPNLTSFKAALELINSTDMRVVYLRPGAQDISDEAFNFIDGLILGEKDGAVTVLGTVKGGDGDRAGFLAGDRIETFNGQDLKGSLATFADLFQQAGKTTIGEQKPYIFHVQRPSSATSLDLSIRPPPSLGGSLLDQ